MIINGFGGADQSDFNYDRLSKLARASSGVMTPAIPSLITASLDTVISNSSFCKEIYSYTIAAGNLSFTTLNTYTEDKHTYNEYLCSILNSSITYTSVPDPWRDMPIFLIAKFIGTMPTLTYVSGTNYAYKSFYLCFRASSIYDCGRSASDMPLYPIQQNVTLNGTEHWGYGSTYSCCVSQGSAGTPKILTRYSSGTSLNSTGVNGTCLIGINRPLNFSIFSVNTANNGYNMGSGVYNMSSAMTLKVYAVRLPYYSDFY